MIAYNIWLEKHKKVKTSKADPIKPDYQKTNSYVNLNISRYLTSYKYMSIILQIFRSENIGRRQIPLASQVKEMKI